MAALSNYAEDAVLSHLIGKTSFALPDVSVALYTAAPTDNTSGTEVSGGDYARLATSASDWDVANGTATNTVDFEWPTASADWGSVTSAALVDGDGNILVFGMASSPKEISQGDSYRIPQGSFTLSLD